MACTLIFILYSYTKEFYPPQFPVYLEVFLSQHNEIYLHLEKALSPKNCFKRKQYNCYDVSSIPCMPIN